MNQTAWKEKSEITVRLTINYYLNYVDINGLRLYPGDNRKMPSSDDANIYFHHQLYYLDPGVTLAIKINGDIAYKETGLYSHQLLENPIKLNYRIKDGVDNIKIEWIYGY